ncbi:MAG TPA: hypothetical protein VFD58_36410 [Blastocatellia bacterium]|nr:hypothetical protein [Blastocatellia bacterium]
MLTEYRQRFTRFQTELRREEYLFRSGQKDHPETAHIYSDESDLFSRSSIGELEQALADVSEYRETERDAIRRLIAFAIEGGLAARVRELSAEVADYEARATIKVEAHTISFQAASAAIASEPDRQRRHELEARCDEVIKGSQDLRAERLERLHEAAQGAGGTPGSGNYLTLYRELRGVDYETVAARATGFLSETESRYVTAFAPLLVRDARVSIDEATRADIEYFGRLARFDEHFPPWRWREVYEETFRGLGIRTWQQSNIQLDDRPSPRKRPRPFCSPIQIPDEIKLVINPGGGPFHYQGFLHEAGRAQHFAWTSPNLYPEFRYSGDAAVTETYAALFQYLLLDEKWLAQMPGFHESAEFRQTLAVHKLMRARCHAAMIKYEVELHAGKLKGVAGQRYAELLSDAARVKYDEAGHLRDAGDDFHSAECLRALAFEAQLREYLKSKYGSRWWTSRKAGEMLIDLWNIGLRYPAERLAAMIGLGELSFDWLAAELSAQINPKT